MLGVADLERGAQVEGGGLGVGLRLRRGGGADLVLARVQLRGAEERERLVGAPELGVDRPPAGGAWGQRRCCERRPAENPQRTSRRALPAASSTQHL